MKHISIDARKRRPISAAAEASPASAAPTALTEPRFIIQGFQDRDWAHIESSVLEARLLIVEGIPGSGKDTFQAYLKERLKGREVHDYSEGELLQSWKHFPIEGIRKLRVDFMKLFVNSVKNTLNRDKNVVFLLNRFHLAAYVTTIFREPELTQEYDKVIEILKTMPVHVFVLQLDEHQIEERSAHRERSGPWPTLQQQMVIKDGFHNKFERYSWQQRTMLETAQRQRIPYSVIWLPAATEGKEARGLMQRNMPTPAARDKVARKKREYSETT